MFIILVHHISNEITPKCIQCEYIDVFRTAEMPWHNFTYFGYWPASFIFHEHNMSFTWNGGVLYHLTKLLNRKFKIRQTIKFLMDARFPGPNLNYTMNFDVLLIEVNTSVNKAT